MPQIASTFKKIFLIVSASCIEKNEVRYKTCMCGLQKCVLFHSSHSIASVAQTQFNLRIGILTSADYTNMRFVDCYTS